MAVPLPGLTVVVAVDDIEEVERRGVVEVIIIRYFKSLTVRNAVGGGHFRLAPSIVGFNLVAVHLGHIGFCERLRESSCRLLLGHNLVVGLAGDGVGDGRGVYISAMLSLADGVPRDSLRVVVAHPLLHRSLGPVALGVGAYHRDDAVALAERDLLAHRLAL